MASNQTSLVNPFSTHRFRPGEWPYWMPDGSTANRELLFDVVREHRCVGIIGPHGTGKTTLLKWWLDDHRESTHWSTMHSGQIVGPDVDRPPSIANRMLAHAKQWQNGWRLARQLRTADASTQRMWVVDGWEQIPALIRGQIQLQARSRDVALIVTSHRDHHGVHIIHRTTVDARRTLTLVDRLLDDERFDQDACQRVRDHARDQFAKQHVTDVREFLFELYDVYHQHQRQRDISFLCRGSGIMPSVES